MFTEKGELKLSQVRVELDFAFTKGPFGKSYLFEIELIQIDLFEIESFQYDFLASLIWKKENLSYCQSYMGKIVI